MARRHLGPSSLPFQTSLALKPLLLPAPRICCRSSQDACLLTPKLPGLLRFSSRFLKQQQQVLEANLAAKPDTAEGCW